MSKPRPDWLSKLESRLSLGTWVWHALPAGATAMLMGWVAAVTDALKATAPFSIVAAAATGFALYAISAAALAWRGTQATIRRRFEAMAVPSSDANPMEPSYTNKRIDLAELAHPTSRRIEGKTFVGCELVSRVPVYLSGCHIDAGRKVLYYDCDLIVLKPGSTFSVRQGIHLKDCHLRDTQFVGMTVAFNQSTAKDIVKQHPQFANDVLTAIVDGG